MLSLMEVYSMTDTTPLSPAAQAVLDALHTENSTGPERYWARANAVAALRAVADQVVPPALEEEFFDRNHALPLQKKVEIRLSLLAIAAELEAQ
jgi:hypothetical protein